MISLFSVIITLPVLCFRAAQYGGRFLRRETSVTRVRGVFIWWRGSVLRGFTSTESVFVVLPAALPCDRERMLSTPNRVSIFKCLLLTALDLNLTKKEQVQKSLCYITLTFAVILQENCTANFILINATMGQTYGGICLCVQWVMCISNNINLI